MSPSSSGVSSLGSSWNSPTLTPPFPLPSDSPVSALLELSGDYTMEKNSDTDEGIVSDQSYEYDDNHKRKKVGGYFFRKGVEIFFWGMKIKTRNDYFF